MPQVILSSNGAIVTPLRLLVWKCLYSIGLQNVYMPHPSDCCDTCKTYRMIVADLDTLVEAGVAISMAEVGKATQIGYVEHVIHMIEEEEVHRSYCQDFSDANTQTRQCIDNVHQTKRIHSALGHLTPTGLRIQ